MIRAMALAAALWIGLAALVLAARETPAAPAAARAASATGGGELARCRVAGQAAGDDPACRAAWAQARARFLGSRP